MSHDGLAFDRPGREAECGRDYPNDLYGAIQSVFAKEAPLLAARGVLTSVNSANETAGCAGSPCQTGTISLIHFVQPRQTIFLLSGQFFSCIAIRLVQSLVHELISRHYSFVAER